MSSIKQNITKIRQFFNNHSPERVLTNWTDFQNECDNNRGCLGIFPIESDNCKNILSK